MAGYVIVFSVIVVGIKEKACRGDEIVFDSPCPCGELFDSEVGVGACREDRCLFGCC